MVLQKDMEITKTYKKYANRHIYCLGENHFVELPEIFSTVRNGFSIQVIESKSKRDITLNVLLECIRQKEDLSDKDTAFLNRIIRADGCSFSKYIEQLENKKTTLSSSGLFQQNMDI